MKQTTFETRIEHLKRCVRRMLLERMTAVQAAPRPAGVWSDALSTMEYVLYLRPRDFEQIRLHCGMITGEFPLRYWHLQPPPEPEPFAKSLGYDRYANAVPETYRVSELPVPRVSRPLGVLYENKVINYTVSRYQQCISNLYLSSVLPQLLERAERKLIVEIGGGFGGLAHHLGSFLSNGATYVIIDLPELLLFSGGYLSLHNPGKKIYVYERESFTSKFLKGGLLDYDYVLLPNYALSEMEGLVPDIDLMLNTSSFQEMSSAQVDAYLSFGARKVSGMLYSDNNDRHPFNNDLAPETVTSLLSRYFCLWPSPSSYSSEFASALGGMPDSRVYLGVGPRFKGSKPITGSILMAYQPSAGNQ